MKVLMFIADGVEDLEFFYSYYRLLEEGFTVDVAGPKRGVVTGKHGYTFETNLSFADPVADDYDILVLPGGRGPETVRLDGGVLQICREMMDAGKIIAAICHGPQVLISADLVRGKNATCWQGVRDDLKAAGAIVHDEEVVVDGNLITSRKPEDLPAFCREITRLVHAESKF